MAGKKKDFTEYKANNTSQYEITDTLSVAKSTLYQKSQLAPYNPDDIVQKFGASGQGLDRYEKMLTDDAVKASLITKKSAVIASGWQILPATEDESSIEIAKWIENNLRETYVGSFDASLYEMLDAFEYGFTVTEKIYEIEDGQLKLKQLKTRPSQSFEFHCDDSGNLLEDGIRQWTMRNVISIPQDKVIIYTYDKKRDNYYGTSDLRSAYRPWFSKDFTIKMMNIAIERMGNPLLVSKYSNTASAEDRQNMQKIVDNISGKTSVLFPDSASFDFIQPPNNMDLFQKALDIYNLAIMKAILLPEKLGFGGDTGGSYALGKVQQNTYFWILDKIRNEIEVLINEELIKQLVDYNFGFQEIYPKFKFKPLSEENKDEKAKIIIDAIARGGLYIDLQTENFLRTLLGMPEKLEETNEQDQNEIKANADKDAEDKAEASSDEDELGDDNDEGDESDHKQNLSLKKQFKLRRKPNDYEKKVDFEKVNNELEKNTTKAVSNLQNILMKIRDDYTNQIMRKKILENKDINAVKTLEFKYIRDYALECESFLRQTYTQGKATARDMYKISKKSFAKPTTNVGLVKSKALIYLKDKARILAGSISGKLQNQARAIVADGVLHGDPVNLIVERVDETFAPLVAKAKRAGYNYDGKSLYSPINTEIARAYSAGMSEYNKDLEASGEIVAYEWSAILDAVTTEGCNELDGMIFETTDSIWNDLHTPRHYNCRSLLIPIYRDEEYVAEDGKDVGIKDEF